MASWPMASFAKLCYEITKEAWGLMSLIIVNKNGAHVRIYGLLSK